MSAADPPPAIRTLQAMDPKDVPMALVDAAWPVCEREGIPWHDDAVRMILAAVIPAIRAQAIADAYNEVTKLHDASTYQDGYGWFERAAYANVLDALTRIARGDQ